MTDTTEETAVELVPLTEPADGLPNVIESKAGVAEYARALAAATGPIAIDAERASGYRYGQHNYLIQIRREGAGTALIDPIAVPDLSALFPVLNSTEWVLHAASQDIPSLAEQGLIPAAIFDTELAGRLLGLERVGLGYVVAELMGLALAKEHSAADWSTRPLPKEWLRYAALDVEVLIDLRTIMSGLLEEAGKTQWAHQEFEHVRLSPPPAPRIDPWRRLSKITEIKNRRNLAIAKELWLAREAYSKRRDTAPGRTLPDRAIVAAAKAAPRSVPELLAVREFNGRAARSRIADWHAAIAKALALPEQDLPPMRGVKSDGPPPPRSWAERSPVAGLRLERAKEVLARLAEKHTIPVENIVQPDALRRLCWTEPFAQTAAEIDDFLASRGVRPWQRTLLAEEFANSWSVPNEPDA